jgi:hypothetical protein
MGVWLARHHRQTLCAVYESNRPNRTAPATDNYDKVLGTPDRRWGIAGSWRAEHLYGVIWSDCPSEPPAFGAADTPAPLSRWVGTIMELIHRSARSIVLHDRCVGVFVYTPFSDLLVRDASG